MIELNRFNVGKCRFKQIVSVRESLISAYFSVKTRSGIFKEKQCGHLSVEFCANIGVITHKKDLNETRRIRSGS